MTEQERQTKLEASHAEMASILAFIRNNYPLRGMKMSKTGLHSVTKCVDEALDHATELTR